MTEQSNTGEILLSIHHEDMKQISPDEPNVTERSCSLRNNGKLQAKLLLMLMMLISPMLVQITYSKLLQARK